MTTISVVYYHTVDGPYGTVPFGTVFTVVILVPYRSATYSVVIGKKLNMVHSSNQ